MPDAEKVEGWTKYRSDFGIISDDELASKLKDALALQSKLESTAVPQILKPGAAPAAPRICLIQFDDPKLQTLCVPRLKTAAACTSYGTALGGSGNMFPGSTCPTGAKTVE